jgi:glycerol-3-phosphate acyltransferase PlsX
MEGLAKLVANNLREAFNKNFFTKFVALLSLPVLNSFKKKLDPNRYNGASLLGLKGIVIKSHGGANIMAFANAIDIAMNQVEKDIPNKIKLHLEKQLG